LSQPGKTTASIKEILSQELSAHGGVESDNLSQRGPELSVPSKQAQVLSMAFHELATNAVKHGALSTKSAHIDVFWNAEPAENAQHVCIHWRERGVTINHAPRKRGFGSEILEKSIPEMLKGSFNRTFHPDGIECVIEFDIRS
jgi:two-component sensor histidine kinase